METQRPFPSALCRPKHRQPTARHTLVQVHLPCQKAPQQPFTPESLPLPLCLAELGSPSIASLGVLKPSPTFFQNRRPAFPGILLVFFVMLYLQVGHTPIFTNRHADRSGKYLSVTPGLRNCLPLSSTEFPFSECEIRLTLAARPAASGTTSQSAPQQPISGMFLPPCVTLRLPGSR